VSDWCGETDLSISILPTYAKEKKSMPPGMTLVAWVTGKACIWCKHQTVLHHPKRDYKLQIKG